MAYMIAFLSVKLDLAYRIIEAAKIEGIFCDDWMNLVPWNDQPTFMFRIEQSIHAVMKKEETETVSSFDGTRAFQYGMGSEPDRVHLFPVAALMLSAWRSRSRQLTPSNISCAAFDNAVADSAAETFGVVRFTSLTGTLARIGVSCV